MIEEECTAVCYFFQLREMIAATHNSVAHSQYQAAISWLDDMGVVDVQWTHKLEAVSQS